jgi:GNAT superfamily N-acetyltransferase
MTEIVYTTDDPRITLRFATEDDVPLILDFIRQLADFEKLSHEVVADEETLRASLFSERQVAEVVIAYRDSEAAGFALFCHNFSTYLGKPGIYLEDLYVVPAERSHGIGGILLSFLAKLATERGCGRLELSVLLWNEDAIRFYNRLGATAINEWTVFRIAGKNLEKLAGTVFSPKK